jgi:hypothetical protein
MEAVFLVNLFPKLVWIMIVFRLCLENSFSATKEEKMNKRILFFFLFLGFLASCSQGNFSTSSEPTPNPDLYPCDNLPAVRAEEKAFKGIELYSYPNSDDQWVFSVLSGTNRIKTYQEVTGQSLNINQLENCFCKLAVGESIKWGNTAYGSDEDFSFHAFPIPPDTLQSNVFSLALDCEIELVALFVN